MKLKYFLKCALFLIFPSIIAQNVMTLEKCRALALENNKSVAIAEYNREIAELTQQSYKSNYFPKLSASGNYLYSNVTMNRTLPGNYLPTFVPDPATGQLVPNILTMNPDGTPVFNQYAYFPDMDIVLKLSGTWMAGLIAEQPIYMGGKITAAHRMSKIGSQIANLNQTLTNAEIIVKTDEAYWTYVQTTELVKLALSYREVVTELMRNVQNAHEIGLIHRNDVLKVQVKINEAELQLLRAENGVTLSRKNLCRIIGLPFDSDITLPETLDEPLLITTNHSTTHTNRPEYAMIEKQIELKEQQVRLVQSDFMPQAGVMANYGYMNGLTLNGEKLLDRASLTAIVSVSIPLFQWGEGRNKIRSAQIERDVIKLQHKDISEQMELELAQAAARRNEAELETLLTARSLEQAQENMKVSGDRYAEGMETLADFLEAQTVWQRAWTEHINAKARQRINETYYLKAGGGL